MAIAPIVIRLTGENQDARQAVREVKDDLAGVGDAGKDAASGLNSATDGARNLDGAASDAGDASEALSNRMERMRGIGAGITVASAAMLGLSANLRAGAEEGAGAVARLEAVFEAQKRIGELPGVEDAISDVTVRGHFDDDDGIRQGAVLLANWEVQAAQMPALLEAAGRQAQTTGQDFEGLANSFGKAVGTGDFMALKKSAVSFSEVEIAAIKAGYAVSQQAGQMALVDSITAAVARTTGELGSSLSAAEKASNDAARGFGDFKDGLGAGASEMHTAIQTGITIPLLEVANSQPGLLKAAGGILEIGGSVGAIGGPMIGLAGQIGLIRLGFAGAGASGVAAFSSMAKAALAAAPAMWAALVPILPVLIGIAAAAVLAAGAMYALDKAIHAKEDAELSANIKKGEAADPKVLESVNKERRRKGQQELTLEQLRAWQNDDSGDTTDPLKEQSKAPDPSGDLDALKRQLSDLQSGKVVAPSMPSSATLAPMPSNELHKAQPDSAKKGEDGAKEADRRATEDARDALTLSNIRRNNQRDARIGTLEDGLQAAKDAGNAERVKSLTLQIELAKSQVQREEDLAEAALEADASHRAALIAQANEIFQGAAAAANRSANRAARGVKGDGKSRDAAIRARLAGGGQGAFRDNRGFRTLEPTAANAQASQAAQIARDTAAGEANIARSAQIEAGRNRAGSPGAIAELAGVFAFGGNLAAMLQPPRQNPTARAGDGIERGSIDSNGVFKTGKPAISQNANGSFKVEFEPIEIPNQSIGSLRGRVRR